MSDLGAAPALLLIGSAIVVSFFAPVIVEKLEKLKKKEMETSKEKIKN